MTIRIQFSRNRWERGFLTVAGTQFGCPCLGRADQAAAAKVGNPFRNPLRRNGDTPTGTYRAWVGKVLRSERSYGPHPVIRLDPIGGDALEAKRNGRAGLLIHGGDPAADGRSLRPTHGCVRVSNFHQKALLDALAGSGEEFHLVVIEEKG